jgi:hypothetical protein
VLLQAYRWMPTAATKTGERLDALNLPRHDPELHQDLPEN